MPEPVVHTAEEASAEEASMAYLDQFAQLDGSVPDLAATLTTQAEQDAEDANISFLRADLPEEDEEPTLERYEESRRRRRRAVDAMLGGRRYTPEQMREMEEPDDRATFRRTDEQDYHGWAPGTSDDEEDYSTFEARPSLPPPNRMAEEHALRREESQNLRERMRNRLRRDHLEAQLDERSNTRRQLHSENVESDAEQGAPAEASGAAGQGPATESSLRTTALLQAVYRNSQFSAYSRNQLQRYILDRERSGNEVEDRAPALQVRSASTSALSPSQRRQINRDVSGVYESERQRMHTEYQHQLALLDQRALNAARSRGQDLPRSERRIPRYWPSQPEWTPKRSTTSIENTIKYLERLRLCESDQEGLETAEERGFESEERNRSDFLLDTTIISPPPQSSWLEIGGVLSGTQSVVTPSRDLSASSTPQASYAPVIPPSQYRSRIRHPTFGTTTARTTSPVRRDSPRPVVTQHPPDQLQPQAGSPRNERPWIDSTTDERWPVKVTIHSIDYNAMTLSGTMEACNVPDKTSPTHVSSITTFLEGEIIDFNKHTLETKSFKADARIDAVYWRKLPPFSHLGDDTAMTKKLLSKEWLREELMEKWILMRWKEKCFVTPADAQSSLTISGFYYISLRRSDGHVEGFYYDPIGTPYQHLVLSPERKTFPSYAFQ